MADATIGGRKYPFGTTGTIVLNDLDRDTKARFTEEGRYALIVDQGGPIVVPSYALGPA
jgi:hypothetical protein